MLLIHVSIFLENKIPKLLGSLYLLPPPKSESPSNTLSTPLN